MTSQHDKAKRWQFVGPLLVFLLIVATNTLEASVSRSAMMAIAMFVICLFLRWQKLTAEARVALAAAVALAIVSALQVARY